MVHCVLAYYAINTGSDKSRVSPVVSAFAVPDCFSAAFAISIVKQRFEIGLNQMA